MSRNQDDGLRSQHLPAKQHSSSPIVLRSTRLSNNQLFVPAPDVAHITSLHILKCVLTKDPTSNLLFIVFLPIPMMSPFLKLSFSSVSFHFSFSLSSKCICNCLWFSLHAELFLRFLFLSGFFVLCLGSLFRVPFHLR